MPGFPAWNDLENSRKKDFPGLYTQDFFLGRSKLVVGQDAGIMKISQFFQLGRGVIFRCCRMLQPVLPPVPGLRLPALPALSLPAAVVVPASAAGLSAHPSSCRQPSLTSFLSFHAPPGPNNTFSAYVTISGGMRPMSMQLCIGLNHCLFEIDSPEVFKQKERCGAVPW